MNVFRAEMKLHLTLTKFKTYSRNGKIRRGKNRAIPYF